MNKEFNKLIAFLDVGDFRFIILILNKNLKNLLFLSILVSILTLIISMNIEKKFESVATIVISPEENNIVNIEKV